MWVIKNRKIFLALSAIFVAGALVLIFTQGLKFGIEFTGGSLTEVSYLESRPEVNEIRAEVETLSFGEFIVQPTQEKGVFIKTRSLTENERVDLINALSFDGQKKVEEKSFTSIGPSVGKELKSKSTIAIVVVSISIILFIAYAFRKVSKPISSWKYGIIAIITLMHDVTIATGAFAVMGKLMGAEVDTLFVVAVLTILGLSINDTIVVFDRIRENLGRKFSTDFKEVVGKSLDETYARSINTSLATVIVLLALFFFGPESTKVFSMTMAIGMFFGTYSSVFLASPLLVVLEENQKED
ncbi:MAG: preprotein translocase subunit SecF [Patescibacteria group bacterium]|jgi:preprotein translocase subunit SecF|nr:preprotein translocase subunit SecF [Patescibacteria group bacterium]